MTKKVEPVLLSGGNPQIPKGEGDPVPPESSKTAETRYLHLHEDDLDEAQVVSWIDQASKLPGEKL